MKVVFPADVAYKDWHGPGEFDVPLAEALLLLQGGSGIVLGAGETLPEPTAQPAEPPPASAL